MFNLLEFLAEVCKCNDCPNYYIGQTGRSFKTWYTEHIQSNFAEHIFNTHHTYTDTETNLEILHILPKCPKLNTTEQYEIYKHYKQSPTNILNDQIHYKSHTLFDTIIHCSHNNISANPTTTNGTLQPVPPGLSSIKNDAHGIEKLLLKIQVSLTSFLHSEVNQIIHIIVQDQGGQNNNFWEM